MTLVWMDGFDGYGNGNGVSATAATLISPTQPNAEVQDVMFERYVNPSNNLKGAEGSLISEGGENIFQGQNQAKGRGRFDFVKLIRQGIRVSQIEDRFVVDTSNFVTGGVQTWTMGFGLFIHTTEKGESIRAPITTLPEKCVWGNDNITVYCGVPSDFGQGAYPDIWYQGVVSFSDVIWMLNTETNAVELLATPIELANTEMDIIKPFLSENENYLFFTNKKDMSLWVFDLQPALNN